MRICAFYSCLLYFGYCQLLISIFYSSFTDLELVSSMQDSLMKTFGNEIEIHTEFLNQTKSTNYFVKDINIALDLTFSTSLSTFLKEAAYDKHFIILSLQDQFNIINDWQFYIHISTQNQVKALKSVVNYVGWEKFIVIFDENNYYLSSFLKDEFKNKNAIYFHFINNSTQASADLFIGKEIKPTGIRNFIILNSEKSARNLIKSLKAKNLMMVGSGVILGTEAFANITENGILGYTELGLENATDFYSYEILAIQKIIKNILSFYSYTDPYALRAFLEIILENHNQISNFSLINIQNQQKIIVGTIENENLNLQKNIIWPGNSTIIPNSPYTNITISIADGSTNPNGQQTPNMYAKKVKDGALYALDYIKTIEYFQGFQILATHTDCGADAYNASYNLNCFRQLKNQLGVGFLTSILGLLVTGNILSFRALNISIPHISEYAVTSALTPKKAFPEFMRVAKDSQFNAAVIIQFCTIYGWNNIIALYENNSGPMFAYKQLENQANLHNINIVNSQEQRLVKSGYQHSDYAYYKPWMQNYINSKVRIYVVFLSSPFRFYFFEDLYDTGVRRGEVVFLFYDWIMNGFDQETDPVQQKKLRELFYGCLMIAQADWIGEYGQEIKQGFMKTISNDTEYRCFSFDSAMLLFNGIKYTLDQGGNLENSSLLNANLRIQKFVGCSGTVSIDPTSNDRSSNIMGIYNLRENKKTGILYENWVGRYDLGSTQLFTFWDEIIWYDNTTNFPSDIITYDNCPFDEDLIRYSKKGAGILYAISFSILIIAVAITAAIWKRWWNFPYFEMTEKRLIQFEDYLEIAIIIVDFFQFIAVGPDISGYDIFSSTLAMYGTLNFWWVTKGEIFWIYVYATLFAVLAWVYFSAQIIFSFGDKFSNWFCSYSKIIGEKILPILGNILFLPIVSVLLNVLQCDQSIGSDLTQSFVHNDCSTFCWKENHIVWASLSIVSLVLYLPLALYFRPFWVNLNKYGNIKPRPFFLFLKNLFQISIIILNKTLKTQNQPLHGLTFVLLLSCFTGVCYFRKPYNYSRCNLWLIISYLAVLWSVSLSSIYWISPYHSVTMWIVIQWLGWLVLCTLGLIFQIKYCPSLLFVVKAPDIGLLFRFALGKSVTANDVNKSKNEISYNNYILSEEQSKEKLKSKDSHNKNQLDVSIDCNSGHIDSYSSSRLMFQR